MSLDGTSCASHIKLTTTKMAVAHRESEVQSMYWSRLQSGDNLQHSAEVIQILRGEMNRKEQCAGANLQNGHDFQDSRQNRHSFVEVFGFYYAFFQPESKLNQSR